MTTSPIEDRLRASVRFDAANGDSHERLVCSRQMTEAANEIKRLCLEVTAYRYTLEAIYGMKVDEDTDLLQIVALMKATAKTGLTTA